MGRGPAAGYSSAIQDHRQLMHSSGGESCGRWGDGGDGGGGGGGGDDGNGWTTAAMAEADGVDGAACSLFDVAWRRGVLFLAVCETRRAFSDCV